MPNKNGEMGKRWERELAGLLGSSRITRKGDHNDVGDLGDPDWVIEAKDDQSHSLSSFIDQMLAARERSGKRWGVVLLKHRRRPARDGYALMPIWLWIDLRDYVQALNAWANTRGGIHDRP